MRLDVKIFSGESDRGNTLVTIRHFIPNGCYTEQCSIQRLLLPSYSSFSAFLHRFKKNLKVRVRLRFSMKAYIEEAIHISRVLSAAFTVGGWK